MLNMCDLFEDDLSHDSVAQQVKVTQQGERYGQNTQFKFLHKNRHTFVRLERFCCFETEQTDAIFLQLHSDHKNILHG